MTGFTPSSVRSAAHKVADPGIEMRNTQPTLIVLGAGRGSRYLGGGHKLARPLRGASLFSLTLDGALGSGFPLRVVTTEPLLHLVLPKVARRDVVLVPEVGTDPRLGLGYSIAAGVRAALDAPGWLVWPADMPLVRPATIDLISRGLGAHPVTYPRYQGRRGHPVGFSGELVSELVGLSGDEGARRVVASYPAHGVDVDDAGVLQDFDTEEDFLRAERGVAAGLALGEASRDNVT